MKLKYVGPKKRVSLHVKNEDGTMGISVEKGNTFECTAQEGLWVMATFNKNPDKPLFVEASQPAKTKMKEPSKKG
jgi:hypothetical protein